MRSGIVKRALDIACAATGLIVGMPVLAAAAAAIKVDSRGPVLFRQERVGKHGALFQLVKLRTMIQAAPHRGLAVTADGDPRITRVGRWLRKAKLDELPQLWNVLRGELSVVGPRPEVPRYVAMYRPEWQRLLDVRPGLTDLASLTFRDEEALLAAASDRERAYTDVIMPLKLQLALEGVDSGSIRYDLGIVMHTVRAILRAPSARANAVLEEARRQIAELERSSERRTS